jgi:hypothetical protein
MGDIGGDGIITFKRILEKLGVAMRTGFLWFTLGGRDGFM